MTQGCIGPQNDDSFEGPTILRKTTQIFVTVPFFFWLKLDFQPKKSARKLHLQKAHRWWRVPKNSGGLASERPCRCNFTKDRLTKRLRSAARKGLKMALLCFLENFKMSQQVCLPI